MANNTVLNSGSGGQTIPSYTDAAGLNWPAGLAAYGTTISSIANSSVLVPVDMTHGLPIQPMTGATFALAAGTAVIGHVIVDSGTISTITNVVHVDDNAGSLTVDNAGTFAVQASQAGTWNITNISGTVSLPTGASTAAKQPALGTAGTASSDVITVQGIVGMTALKVDGSAVTQPISGTVTANAGTNLNTSLLALEGGNLATLAGAVSAAKVQVNVADINGVAPTMGNGISGTGVQRVTIASDSTGQVALAAGSAVIGHVILDSGTLTSITNVVHVDDNAGSLTVDNAGTFAVQASQAGTWNITNVSGTVSLPTGASTATNQTVTQTPITPALATATKGELLGVQYNATQATFTDGQQGSVQCTSRGAVLVGTGADTFNVTVNTALPAGTNAIGKLAANSGVTIGAVEIAAAQTLATVSTVTSLTQMNGQAISMGTGVRDAGTQRVTIATNDLVPVTQTGSTSTSVTMQNAAVATGNGTVLNVDGYSAAAMTVTGTFVGTITFEGSEDGTNFSSLNVSQLGTSTISTTTTTTGTFEVSVSGLKQLRARISAYTSGSITITAHAVPVPFTARTVVVQPGNTANTTAWLVTDNPVTTGGLSSYSFLSTAAVQSAQIKGSAGQVYGIQFFNVQAAAVYVRLYNQTGAPASTDTANIVWRGIVPGNTAAAGFSVSFEKGYSFSTGIGIRVTGAVADNDTTALAANVVTGNVQYK